VTSRLTYKVVVQNVKTVLSVYLSTKTFFLMYIHTLVLAILSSPNRVFFFNLQLSGNWSTNTVSLLAYLIDSCTFTAICSF
jgi:hypothetical protein